MGQPYLTAVIAAGFSSAIGQVLILRELLVLFHGNELSSGVTLAGWLLWTGVGSSLGGYWSTRLGKYSWSLAAGLSTLAVLLPLTLLGIRASRIVWSTPPGEQFGPGVMLITGLLSLSLFCLASGLVFALAWSMQKARTGTCRERSVLVYAGEAIGAAAGGLCFYFVLLPTVSALTTAWAVSMLLAVVALAVTLLPPRHSPPGRRAVGVCCLVLGGAALALLFVNDQEKLSRRWQWGIDPLLVRDTPFHNLTMLSDAGQYTLFSNGLWLFSIPDPQSAEFAVHPALLQHPHPRAVLLLGGGVSGSLSEVLKHPQVEAVDYVEPDPEILRMAEQALPHPFTAVLRDPRVSVLHSDAGSFVRAPPRLYDVVLLNVGDPLNADINRFYTTEFYRRIQRLLRPGGLLSFGVSSSPDILGPAQARFLQSIHTTLRIVFPFILVYPGDSARFFASSTREHLLKDPQALIDRIAARGLELLYVREYYLFDHLSPMRLSYLESMLATGPPTAVNRDFEPTCYLESLIVWSAQVHPLLERTLEWVSGLRGSWLAAVPVLLTPVPLLLSRRRLLSPRSAILASVWVVGATQMVVEIVLLLAFQILEGFVYKQLALIVTFFMVGMSLGAFSVERTHGRLKPFRRLVQTQACLCAYLPAMLGLLHLLHQLAESAPLPQGAFPVVFSFLASISGFLGGAHFSLAVKACGDPTLSIEESGQTTSPGQSSIREDPFHGKPSEAGPILYALDLTGAAMGAVGASFILIPVLGLSKTIGMMTVFTVASTLWLRDRNAL